VTYAIGEMVDGYVLTERGWVPRLDLDTSPFRPGHVVNGAILTSTLEWQPLRADPTGPQQVGDVVENHVLTPSGDWKPLTEQLRDRTGAQVPGLTTDGTTPASPGGPQASTAPQPSARPQTQPRPQPQPQPTHRPRPTYRVGQVVNGHVLTADRGWVPVPAGRVPGRPGPATSSRQETTAQKSGIGGAVGAIAAIAAILALSQSCGV